MIPETTAGMKASSLEDMNKHIIQQHQIFAIFTLTFTNTFLIGQNLCQDLESMLNPEGPMREGSLLHMDLTDYSCAQSQKPPDGTMPWCKKVAWGANTKFAIFLGFGGLMNMQMWLHCHTSVLSFIGPGSARACICKAGRVDIAVL